MPKSRISFLILLVQFGTFNSWPCGSVINSEVKYVFSSRIEGSSLAVFGGYLMQTNVTFFKDIASCLVVKCLVQ